MYPVSYTHLVNKGQRRVVRVRLRIGQRFDIDAERLVQRMVEEDGHVIIAEKRIEVQGENGKHRRHDDGQQHTEEGVRRPRAEIFRGVLQ